MVGGGTGTGADSGSIDGSDSGGLASASARLLRSLGIEIAGADGGRSDGSVGELPTDSTDKLHGSTMHLVDAADLLLRAVSVATAAESQQAVPRVPPYGPALLSVSEPETCIYIARARTFAGCKQLCGSAMHLADHVAAVAGYAVLQLGRVHGHAEPCDALVADTSSGDGLAADSDSYDIGSE